jgi:hypothetical protein
MANDFAPLGALFEGAASLFRGQFSDIVYTEAMPGVTKDFSLD